MHSRVQYHIWSLQYFQKVLLCSCLKVRNLRTRHLYYYIVIDTKGVFVGFIWVKEELKYTPAHAQIVIKILTPFYKTTVNVPWLPKPFEPGGRWITAKPEVHRLMPCVLRFYPHRFPRSCPVVVNQNQTRWNKSGVSAQFLKTRVYFTLATSVRQP